MAFTFIKALGFEIGKSLVEDDMLDLAKQILEQAMAQKIKFYLPVDCVVAASLEPDAETMIVTIQEIPPGWYGMDIGPASVRLFAEAVQNAKTILWNGPMGVFERDAFSRGTFALAHSVANAYAKTIVGGGDTALAVYKAGESESMSFISTGGGAALQLLEGKFMPGLAALPDRPY
jgi:phosphoglycerate kinase